MCLLKNQVLSVFPGQWRVVFSGKVEEEVFDSEEEAKLHLALLTKGLEYRKKRSQNNSKVFRKTA